VGDDGAGYVEDALEVYRNEFVKVFVGGFFDGDRGWVYAGAVEDVVYLAELLDF
jgi:hypothetical protein